MSSLVYPNRLSIFEGTTLPRPQLERAGVFDVLNRWAQVLSPPQTSPEGRRLAMEIKRATGWSERAMARSLGTSHPTISKLLEGQAVNSALSQRVIRAHEVISRLHTLTGHDVQATNRALETSEPGLEDAAELLGRGAYAEAYLRALDVLRQRETGMLVGTRPSLIGRANVPLVDEG